MTLKNGHDVTECLYDLPVGTPLIVHRSDGATMNAMWDGDKLTSPKKGKLQHASSAVNIFTYLLFLFLYKSKTVIWLINN